MIILYCQVGKVDILVYINMLFFTENTTRNLSSSVLYINMHCYTNEILKPMNIFVLFNRNIVTHW